MPDIFTKEKRSEIMSRVKSKGNATTEIQMVMLLKKHHIIGWRRHLSNVYGRPDFCWPSKRLALFIDGCFWHGCPRCYNAPKVNKEFWAEKILKNTARDRKVNRKLRKAGWRVVRVWECRLRAFPESVITRVIKIINSINVV